ncbi:error-prone DNA polymerase [Amaricoccus solimangrovi]|uniref:Error-prone DNA polymerase n=1 Tax=Amaricoccus solimangrovi TaxID=2589815 RepID=A0A501WGC1_9RHOB|nr:error-prone DNA polymerase [Amaricoccus solimangrovi]TPE47390.1 error-prone DNA polymerase [Amaricoccus solimangrovi]
MSGFAELVAATSYSFLRGGSHPAEMVAEAVRLGLAGIGIADRNTVAGVVRAHVALRDAPERIPAARAEERRARGEPPGLAPEKEEPPAIPLRLVVGARLVFCDGTPDIVAYPATRRGWGRLTRLLTRGNMRAVKGSCRLFFDDLLSHLDDLLLIVLPASTAGTEAAHPAPPEYDAGEPSPAAPHLIPVPVGPPPGLPRLLSRLAEAAPGRVWLGATMPLGGDDRRRLDALARIAAGANVPLIATNDALYAEPAHRPLADVLACLREGVALSAAGRRLAPNAERHLKSPLEMARLFRSHPEAVAETPRFLARIGFSLDQLRYEYPDEPVPAGWEAQDWLEHLVTDAAGRRYGEPLPEKVRRLIAEEFALIRDQRYAHYFLTVYDLVRFARGRGILCQGRGSAANSIVCFLLGVTSVDPREHDLLFSRFVSEERREPPDIDVDFEHERREEVIQYIYRRYGRHRAGLAATVIHYRSRSAIRETCKALGLGADMATRMTATVWGSPGGSHPGSAPKRKNPGGIEQRITEAGFALDNPEIARLRTLLSRLLGTPFPRHLSQHVGGFVLTRGRLDEMVPVHNAAMKDRSFIEWDKDDIAALGLMKVDVLALGMLTCVRKAFDLIRDQGLGDHTLEVDLRSDDPAVYAMLRKGDSIGVFQVESRAQINMLPRLRPENLYDLTVQVAIVRPGPIEGEMVHPYLRRRAGIDPVEFPSPAPPHPPNELRELLGKTFGVPLFQEQAMKLAIVAAGFTPSEANRLRRAMATFRNLGNIEEFRDKMIAGMVARGYQPDFAERCFRQIEGFGSYGFPESHALSFARLVYVSAWIKCHHPGLFACALLNSQPMGFYAPAQIVRDAREHGVEVRPIDVNASFWDNAPEPGDRPENPAIRLGFRQIDGFREDWAGRLVAARGAGPFVDPEALSLRAGLPARVPRLLADADAFGSMGLSRREGLWAARRAPESDLPLFAAARARALGEEPAFPLPPMPEAEEVATDYQTTRLSLRAHPMAFLRDIFRAEGVLDAAGVAAARDGARIRAAGIVLVRQRPGKGNAIFVTIEDETGIVNVLIWARIFETMRRPVMASRLMLVEGRVQRGPEGVTHLMGTRVEDRSALLSRLTDLAEAPPPRAGHPRSHRTFPKSRDFH